MALRRKILCNQSSPTFLHSALPGVLRVAHNKLSGLVVRQSMSLHKKLRWDQKALATSCARRSGCRQSAKANTQSERWALQKSVQLPAVLLQRAAFRYSGLPAPDEPRRGAEVVEVDDEDVDVVEVVVEEVVLRSGILLGSSQHEPRRGLLLRGHLSHLCRYELLLNRSVQVNPTKTWTLNKAFGRAIP